MNRLFLIGIFAVVFALSLVIAMPMGAALAWTHASGSGLAARAVSGSVWNGRLEDMRLRGIRFGDVRARLDAFALMTGTQRVHLQARDASADLIGGATQGFAHATAVLDLDALNIPLGGVLRLEDASILFENGRCTQAEGRVTADVAQDAWKAPELSGGLSCNGSLAVARLSGRDGNAEVNITFSIGADLRYRLQARVASPDAKLRLALGLVGFAEDAGEMQRIDQGRFGT
jgi:general secretion pathway protein N